MDPQKTRDVEWSKAAGRVLKNLQKREEKETNK